jgi:hypothetical protein
MNEDEQAAESRKYIARQYALVPVKYGLAVYHSYGTHRTLVRVMSDEEFLAFAREEFDHQLSIAEKTAAHHARMAEAEAEREASLLSIDIKL